MVSNGGGTVIEPATDFREASPVHAGRNRLTIVSEFIARSLRSLRNQPNEFQEFRSQSTVISPGITSGDLLNVAPRDRALMW